MAFKRYGPHAYVSDTKKISTSTWANNTNNLIYAYTSSVQADRTDANSQGCFFLDVYNSPTSSISASKEYAIAYGHLGGSGSVDFTNTTGAEGYSATRWTYGQYRQLVYGDENQFFKFGDHTTPDIFVINVERRNYKQNLKPGTLNLHLSSSVTGIVGGFTKIHLTDDFGTKTGSAVLTNMGRQFNIVSGANGIMSGSNLNQTISGSYGLFYPDAGIIILNPRALSASIHGEFSIGDMHNSNQDDNNAKKLLNVISATSHTGDHDGYFICDSEEKITSQYYFTRVRNHEFNYTANPSFIDDSGTLRHNSMVDNPTVFITSVGLYNDGGDLLAVAKLSQPLAKDFTKESLIRVKIDY
jgi:hypothetical protein